MRFAHALLFAASLMPVTAHADCRSSAGRTYSFATHLSPAAGILCLYVVDVFEGPSCDASARRWSTTRGCNETRRMAVTDAGSLISILAPRASRRDWPILRVLRFDGERVVERSIRLGDLPGVPANGTVRLSFEGAAVRIDGRGGSTRVPFESIERP